MNGLSENAADVLAGQMVDVRQHPFDQLAAAQIACTQTLREDTSK
jgi:hypothetical protein